MNPHARYGGVSVPVFVALLVLHGVAVALKGVTDGRSFGVLAIMGLLVIADCLRYLRRGDVRAPASDAVGRPLTAIAGIAAGGAFVVLGVLAALRVIEFD